MNKKVLALLTLPELTLVKLGQCENLSLATHNALFGTAEQAAAFIAIRGRRP